MFAAKTARIACALFAVAAFTGGAQAATYTFDTSENATTHNLGNWSASAANTSTNTNYAAGYSGTTEWRNFFSFNLASLGPNMQVVSATLELRKYGYTSPDASETVQFFDVSTAAATLNNNNGLSISIFNDLGSGTGYGSVALSQAGATNSIVSVSLNGAARADIAAAAGGYFSIGGSCTTCTPSPAFGVPGQNVFSASSATGEQRLIIEAIPAVPEPSTYAMLGIGLAALAFVRRRKAG